MTQPTAATPFDEAERRIWSGGAEAYAVSFAALCAHTVPALLDAAGVGAGCRVLDVGTGPGTLAAAAHARGARVAAVDAEPGMVALAARAVPEADVRYAALPELPFLEGEFDAVVANFVLNHVGRPREALAELRRVVRPGGTVAWTVWATPPAPGQALIGEAMRAAGCVRPGNLPSLAPEDDFPRTVDGVTGLLRDAGLDGAVCARLEWDHRVTPEQWWSGPASGVATVGRTLLAQPAATIAEARRHYDRLSARFAGPDGRLALPHAALLTTGRRPRP